jgi:hypothetical protein
MNTKNINAALGLDASAWEDPWALDATGLIRQLTTRAQSARRVACAYPGGSSETKRYTTIAGILDGQLSIQERYFGIVQTYWNTGHRGYTVAHVDAWDAS